MINLTTQAASELLMAARLAVAYDDLLRKYTGPLSVLGDGDNAEIDAAYDAWISASRAALARAEAA